MSKIVYDSDVQPNALSSLLEGYLSGLSEVCHTLFGARGESAMYEAVGEEFIKYMKKKQGIDFTSSEPWERYCEIIEFFTAKGFYTHVEMDEAGGDRYWMLESGQYAGNIWEEQKAWERGTPPCPLFSVIVSSLAEIGYRIVLDEVDFRDDLNGYESTFHFEKYHPGSEGILARALREIRESIFSSSLLKVVADNTTDAMFLKDLQGRYLFANNAASQFLNNPVKEILGKDDNTLLSPDTAAMIRNNDQEVFRSGGVVTCEEAITTEGVTRMYQTTKGVFRDADGKAAGLFGISRDITERVQARTYGNMGRDILRVLNEPGNLQDSIRRVIAILKTGTGFEAVGIRLQDGDDYPFFVQQGFTKDFLRTENTLIARDSTGGICRDEDGNICLECTCGQVISGKTDPANPYVTQGGSCWTNDNATIPFIDSRLHPRDRCLHDGFQSIALVPIRTKDRIVGLIQFNDPHKGLLTLDKVELLEGIASHISSALMRKQAEEALRRLNEELEQRVEERTVELVAKSDELEEKNTQLERFNKLFVGRELKMVELKKRIRELKRRS